MAWPEYMDTVRAALKKQAEAIAKQGAALDASGGSRGGNEAVSEVDGGSVSGMCNAGAGAAGPPGKRVRTLPPFKKLYPSSNAPEMETRGSRGAEPSPTPVDRKSVV